MADRRWEIRPLSPGPRPDGLFIAPDADSEPTVWFHRPDRPDRPVGLLRRRDLRNFYEQGAGASEFWALIEQALAGATNPAEAGHPEHPPDAGCVLDPECTCTGTYEYAGMTEPGSRDPDCPGHGQRDGTATIALPHPVVTARVCGCGVPPDGAPGGEGCTAECMKPAVVSFGGRVDLDVQDRTIVDGSGEAYTPEVAELHGACLVAAAHWGGA
ncbi:MAG TPA: hypothetical protein VGD67_02290 [Pseudonocardiaceae bacterium]